METRAILKNSRDFWSFQKEDGKGEGREEDK